MSDAFAELQFFVIDSPKAISISLIRKLELSFNGSSSLPVPIKDAYGDEITKGTAMTIERVGIVGAGQMGNGIAHVFALAGYEVLLNDINADALEAAVSLIDRNLERQVSKGQIEAAAKADAMARIGTTQRLIDLGQTDLVIEAATERETIKQAIFEDLVPHLKPDTILTSNTSSISITRLASRTDRPEKFMGFHFMNPVPRHCHRRADVQSLRTSRGKAGQNQHRVRGFPCLHREPHPDADDQRGDLYAV